MRLEIKLNCCQILTDFVIRVYDGTNYGIKRCGMSRNDRYVTAHNLNVVKGSLENAILCGNEALRTDTNEIGRAHV